MTKRSNDDPDNPTAPAQLSLGNIVTSLPAVRVAKKANLMSRVHRRLIEPMDAEQDDQLTFQHSVFCQTSLPFRNPGDDVRLWQKRQGRTFLEIEAGRVYHPALQTTIPVGLPWGVKPRLILAHLNAEALRRQSPMIEVESSLSAFVKRIRGFQHGREIRGFKDQLTRISNGTFRFATDFADGPVQTNAHIITNFKLWPEKDERQRVLWPSEICFSTEYFESLQLHAVPLNEADLATLAHSALAIDLYCWLAQRLHRIAPTKPAFITWVALKQQFGPDYGRMDNFKAFFRKALRQVRARYDRAILDLDDRGITLHHSLPPVTKRQAALPRKKADCGP